MKAKRNIQVKAFLLLVVFSFNTLIGFACALGLKMGYNSHHHSESSVAVGLAHHQHNSHNQQHNHHSQTPSNSNDDCCSNGVTSFNLLDKATTSPVTIFHPTFAVACIGSFYTSSVLPKNNVSKNIRAFAQAYHPPIPDIRIAIQSFQI